jgi:hypothetical protein
VVLLLLLAESAEDAEPAEEDGFGAVIRTPSPWRERAGVRGTKRSTEQPCTTPPPGLPLEKGEEGSSVEPERPQRKTILI